ncbi:hypothetical protein ACWD4K_36480 [Streptomyces gelaticus]
MASNHLEHDIRVIGARRLPIATGAYDLRIVFPGWTLPGVVPLLLLLVADRLVRDGVPVREVTFAQGILTSVDLAQRAGRCHAPQGRDRWSGRPRHGP